MDLDFFSKFVVIIQYFFSSFLGIEMFFIGLILFLFSLFNIKSKSFLVKIVIPIFLLLILLFISGGFSNYVIDSVNAFLKYIMNYYYFPSLSFYYIMTIIVVFVLIYTLFCEKMSVVKRVVNYIFLCIYFTLFLGLMSFIISKKMELTLDYSIYQSDVVLSFVQVSNFIFLLWFLLTCFYRMYLYFQKKYDV